MTVQRLENNLGGFIRSGHWLPMISAVLVTVCLWFADVSGMLHVVADPVYDFCLLAASRISAASSPRVLLVEFEPAGEPAGSPAQLVDLVTHLRELGAERIGIAVDGLELDGPDSAELSGADIYFARFLERNPSDPTHWQFSKQGSSRDRAGNWGCVALPLVERGVCHEQRLGFQIGTDIFPSFEVTLAAGASLAARREPLLSTFRINFRGGSGSLPHVSSSMILAGRLVSELVRGRVVIIGARARGLATEITTPTTAGERGMSLLELQGHAVETLLSGTEIRVVPAGWRLVLMTVIALMFVLVYQRWTVRIAIAAMFLAQAFTTVGSVVVLAWSHWWIPLNQIGIVQFVCLVLVLERKTSCARSAMNRLLFDMSVRVWQRRWPDNFFSQEDPWPQVISFILQTLDLERLIILELPPFQHHLKEVKAANRSLSDLTEPRRDIRRPPYSDSLAIQTPLRLDVTKRLCLSPGSIPEDQYLVPLRFGSKVMGFLAVTVATAKLVDRGTFETRLHDFAQEAAELLYRRQSLQTGQRSHLVERLLSAPEETAYAELVHAANLLDRRLGRLELIYQESTTASAIYDLFGRVLMVNDRMKSILQRERIDLNSLTTVDLVAQLTGTALGDIKRLLGRVIVDKRAEAMPVRLQHQKGAYVLNVRPLVPAATGSASHSGISANGGISDEAIPFEIQGILCELIDHSSVIDMFQIRSQLTETLVHVVRNDLVAVDFTASLMAEDGNLAADRSGYETMIHERVAEAAAKINSCQRGLYFDGAENQAVCVSVDPSLPLDQALDSLRPTLEGRGLTVRVVRPELNSLVFAAPGHLQEVLATVLGVVIEDAHDRSEIEVRIQEQASEVAFRFTNRGIGMWTDSLRDALEGRPTDARYEPLRRSACWIGEWGGNIVGTSQLGEGLKVRIHLRRFQ